MKKLIVLVSLLISMMSITTWANEGKWNNVQFINDESLLMRNGETTSHDEIFSYARGDIFSFAMLDITNMENGEIYICADTYAHRNVDAIYQTVFLDQWDEVEEDWIPVGQWDFERTKEEVGGSLSHWIIEFTLTGYEVDKYYRARGLHGVELDGVVEAKATRTDGVLITDEPV